LARPSAARAVHERLAHRPARRPSVAAAAGAAAAAATTPTAAEARRLRGAVHGERRELARDVRSGAVRAGDLLFAPHELLEMRLALHADVLVDRHARSLRAGSGEEAAA